MKNVCLVLPIICFILLSGCGLSDEALVPANNAEHSFAKSANSWQYQCDEGKIWVAQNKQQAALFVQGKLYLMRQVPVASGVKLVSLDEQAGLRWYSKGQEGFLRLISAGHAAKEQAVFNHCYLLP